MSVPRVGGSWFAHSLSHKQVKAPDEQRREDFTVVGRSDWKRCETRPGRRGKATILPRVFSWLERTAVLGSRGCPGGALVQAKSGERILLRGFGKAGGGFR